MEETSTSVLIVGAGPTGLTLALELALQSIPFLIIDQLPTRSTQSRALVVQPRTLELLHRHGIAGDLMSRGTTGVGARVFVNQTLAADIDLQDLGLDDTSYPLPLWISQAETEAFLAEKLLAYGHVVERPWTAEEMEQDENGVRLLLAGKDGVARHVRCKYVVGCDGAHSTVRRAANLSFEGSAYPQDFMLADVHLSWPQPRDLLLFFLGQGMLVSFPLKDGLVRLISISPPGSTPLGEPTLSDFQQLISALAPGPATLHDPVWLTRFRVHSRGVDNYRAGRLFVAGDAAHIHSPAGGQGMNTGMQDAVNLGWKLARVLRGEKDASLLDSYHAERHRVGQHLLRGTDRMFGYGSSVNPLFLFVRNLLVPWVLPWVMGARGRRMRVFRFVSMLGIRYRGSLVVGTGKAYAAMGRGGGTGGALRGGDRAPDGGLGSRDEGQSESESQSQSQSQSQSESQSQRQSQGESQSQGRSQSRSRSQSQSENRSQSQSPDGRKLMTVLGLCTGPKHHMLFFSGTGKGVADADALRSERSRFLELHNEWAEVHIILSTKRESSSSNDGEDWFDDEGRVHTRYGFVKPGYVLIRPDGHIAHIGLLNDMEELLAWV